MSIKLLVCAFDGIITDGTICVDSTGNRTNISYHYKDAQAIKQLKSKGVTIGVVTNSNAAHTNAITRVCEQLQFDLIYIGEEPKRRTLERWIDQLGISWDEVAYLGCNADDYECMEEASQSACPDGCDEVSSVSDVKLWKMQPGRGILAEIIEYIDY